MIKLEWKISGLAVPANRVADELAKAARAKAGAAARDGIARVRCPIHGSTPLNIRVSGSGDRLRFRYETCCDRLQDAVNASFR